MLCEIQNIILLMFIYFFIGGITIIPLNAMNIFNTKYDYEYILATFICWPIIWIALLIKLIKLIGIAFWVLIKATFNVFKSIINNKIGEEYLYKCLNNHRM